MATTSSLTFLTIAPRAKHTATVVFVHGLGDSGRGWLPLADMFSKDSGLQHVKWVLPNAPVRSVTVNGGRPMPAWFDIIEFGSLDREDEAGMLDTVRSLNELITAEIDGGIPSDRIVLGGFSQGGVMSLFTGLTAERRLAGIAVLSGRLCMRDKVKTMVSEHATKLPIFWGHGRADPTVPFKLATSSVDYLKENLGIATVEADAVLGGGIEFHAYDDLPHIVDAEELEQLKTFIKKVIPSDD